MVRARPPSTTFARPIALTDSALVLVRVAAATLPVDRRDAFLRELAARLGEEPTALAVEHAIAMILERCGD